MEGSLLYCAMHIEVNLFISARVCTELTGLMHSMTTVYANVVQTLVTTSTRLDTPQELYHTNVVHVNHCATFETVIDYSESGFATQSEESPRSKDGVFSDPVPRCHKRNAIIFQITYPSALLHSCGLLHTGRVIEYETNSGGRSPRRPRKVQIVSPHASPRTAGATSSQGADQC